MTDYQEEQAMEVEALESIYMDDFCKISDSPLSYKIHLVPNPSGNDNYVAVSLECVIPSTYPDAAPEFQINMIKGLSDRQLSEMKTLVEQQIQENAGMAMVFTLAETIKDYLSENNRQNNDGSEYQEMLRRMERNEKKKVQDELEKLEKEEEFDPDMPRKLEGTPVTVETFEIWRLGFEAEMDALNAVAKGEKVLKDCASSKLTGRQLWAQGLVNADESAADDSLYMDENLDMEDDDLSDDEDYEDDDEVDE